MEWCIGVVWICGLGELVDWVDRWIGWHGVLGFVWICGLGELVDLVNWVDWVDWVNW